MKSLKIGRKDSVFRLFLLIFERLKGGITPLSVINT